MSSNSDFRTVKWVHDPNYFTDAYGQLPYHWSGKPVVGAFVGSVYNCIVPETGIDCSGFARLCFAAGCGILVPDGSWAQHQWVQSQNFKPSDYENGVLANDDRWRIGFLQPAGSEPGHVFFVQNGTMYESWGGNGIDGSRLVVKEPFTQNCYFYVLTEPV